MKKVLILAYDFPPYVSVGGLRPASWYKHLHEFDVFPIVITRQWSNKYGNQSDYIAPSDSVETKVEETDQGNVIRTPYFPNIANKLMLKYGDSQFKWLRKTVSAYYEFLQFLFFIGPKAPLYFAAKEYLKKNQVDLIIATGDPFILFQYACKLGKIFNTPWIADYRDPWSHDISIQKNFILKIWHSYFEKKIVKNAFMITTVSDYFKTQISTLLKNKDIVILHNGFDAELAEQSTDIIEEHRLDLNIAFAGTIYPYHPLTSFLSVVSEFISEINNARLKLNFYGTNMNPELNDLITDSFQALKPHVNIYPKMSNNLLITELKKNNLMLLFNDYTIIGTKIYDYIGIKRKILLCYTKDQKTNELKKKYYTTWKHEIGNQHVQADLVKKTYSGVIAENSDHLKKLLYEIYSEFTSKGYIACNSIDAEQFSRKIQVEKLANIVKAIK